MIKWFVPLLLLIVLEACADVIAKYYAISNKTSIGIAALSVYVLGNVFWLISLKNGAQLSTGAIIFSLLSQILAIAIGVLVYHEELSKLQIGGIVLGVLSLVLLVWE